jgi:hypothetical protein
MWMCIWGALSSVGLADRRSYVWTYEYQTMPKGAMEVEYYLTHKVSDWNKYDDKNTWDHQVEFEYGLTDHWDVAMYQTWRQTNTEDEDSFDYTGTKLRTRYRIGEKDQLPLDVVLYAEYIFGDGPKEYDKFEGKLILAKDLGKWNIAYNQIYEKKTKNGNDTEHGYATGLSYEFSPVWKMGIESAGNYTEDKYYLGPTASWASEKFWVNLGALRGLNDASNDLQFRLIVGIPF